jgi:hypothetical protein
MNKSKSQSRTQAAMWGLANGFGEEANIPKVAIL